MSESYAGKINRKLLKKRRIINAAAGREKADLVLKNATYVNVFANQLCTADIAVAEGLIVGMGQYSGEVEVDCTGKIVLPGFLDAHISTWRAPLSVPRSSSRRCCLNGTTTVLTDPHEIRQRHGHRRHRVHAPGHGGPAGGRAVHCCLLRPGHAAGRVRRHSGDYRSLDSFYDHPRCPGSGGDDETSWASCRRRPAVEKIVAAQAHHKKIDGHAPDLRATTSTLHRRRRLL